MHELIRSAVVAACEVSTVESLAAIAREEEGDTIYAVESISEELLIEFVEREIARAVRVILIGEGLPEEKMALPRGSTEEAAVRRIIVDPIDGTRSLMYQKGCGWILTGVAPNLGDETSLCDIVLAIQTEIPLVKQHLSDVAWAVRGAGAQAERVKRFTSERTPPYDLCTELIAREAGVLVMDVNGAPLRTRLAVGPDDDVLWATYLMGERTPHLDPHAPRSSV